MILGKKQAFGDAFPQPFFLDVKVVVENLNKMKELELKRFSPIHQFCVYLSPTKDEVEPTSQGHQKK